MITCKKCGESFQDGMRSCPYCGQTVESDSDATSISYIKSFDASKYTNSIESESSTDYEYQMVLNNAKKYYIFNIILWVVIAIIQVIIGIPCLIFGYGLAVLSCAAWNIVISIIMIIFMKEHFSSLENAYNYYYNRRTIAFVLMFVELFLGAMVGAFGNLADVLICRYVVKNAERIFNERNKNSEENSSVPNNDNKQILLQEKKQINITPGLSIESLLKRINLFVEDEKWDEAYAYSEVALDVDATNFEVYLLRTLIEYKVTEVSLLSKYKINDSDNYKKYLRFGGTPLEVESEVEADVETPHSNYEKIEFKKLKIQKVEKKEIDFEALYNEGIKYMQEGQEYSYSQAIQCFFDADEYKDSKEKIVECRNKIEELRINKLKEEEEKKALTEKNNAVEKTSKIYKIIYISLIVFWGLSIFLTLFSMQEIPEIGFILLCPEIVFLVANVVCFVLSQEKVTQKCKKLAIMSLVSAGVALIVSFIFVVIFAFDYFKNNNIFENIQTIKNSIEETNNETNIEEQIKQNTVEDISENDAYTVTSEENKDEFIEKQYSFSDLTSVMEYGLSSKVNNNGELEITFNDQYQSQFYSIPLEIDADTITEIIFDVKSNNAENLAFKLHTQEDYDSDNRYGTPVSYGNPIIIPDTKGCKYFSIMSLDEGTTQAVIASVTFIVSGEKIERNILEKQYVFSNLQQAMEYGVSSYVNGDGALEITFENQYQATYYYIPSDIDPDTITEIVFDVNSNNSPDLAFKLHTQTDYDSENRYGTPVSYGYPHIIPDTYGCKYFSIMSLNEGTTQAVISSVTFKYRESDNRIEASQKTGAILRKKTITRNGDKSEYEYDEKGSLIKDKSDNYECSYKNTYNSDNKIIESIYDYNYGESGKVTYEYDNKGRLTVERSFGFSYSDSEPIYTTRYEYNEKDLLIKEESEGMAPSSFTEYYYDSNNNLIKTVKESDGMRLEDEYENGLLVFRVESSLFDEGDDYYFRWEYDDHGNEVKFFGLSQMGADVIPICDTKNEYNSDGLLIKSTQKYYASEYYLGSVPEDTVEIIMYEYW